MKQQVMNLINTHNNIDNQLCGTPVSIKEGYSKVEFTATDNMIADSSNLVHGGFIFGLADYAAMIAVNHPNVVLGSADTKFLKPVKKGDNLIAEAVADKITGKKRTVHVTVLRSNEKVFEGMFVCFVLDKHVLE